MTVKLGNYSSRALTAMHSIGVSSEWTQGRDGKANEQLGSP
jgi:hypothetical protein